MCAWIKVDQAILTHRKTMIAAERLDVPETQVVGHLVALWGWAVDNAPTGELPASDRHIARAARWEDSPAFFVEALTVAGFIDDDFDGHRCLHDWDEYTGNLMHKRKLNAERQSKYRQNHGEVRNALRNAHVTHPEKSRVPITKNSISSYKTNSRVIDNLHEPDANSSPDTNDFPQSIE